MYSYEDPKIKNKAIKKNKRYKLVKKTIEYVLIGSALLGFVGGALITAGAFDSDPEEKIINYYGDDSKEKDVISYIGLSKKLEELNLEKYEVDPYLFEKYSIPTKLKNPEEIKLLIDNVKFINAFVSSKNINKQSENIETILNLITQKRLVNQYIYTVGYDLALGNVTDATKKYTSEVFGVEEDNLEFSHRYDSYANENLVSIKNGDDRYNIDNVILNNQEKQIQKGVISMDNTQDNFSNYSSEYDKDRNESIISALKTSADLYQENENNDLYNERMASKLK